MLAHCIAALVASAQQPPPAPAFSPTRPWLEKQSLQDLCFEQMRNSDEIGDVIATAKQAEQFGLFGPLLDTLGAAAEGEPDHAEVRKLRREVKSGDRWIPEELARFQEAPPPLPSPLSALTPAQVKELLRRKDARFKTLGSSGVFDLKSDLPSDVSSHYHKVFSSYYRSLKRRFPVWVGSKVEVLVFANRADYLWFFREVQGEGGEHVAGFYTNKSVVFYDDPDDRPMVENTARHECTHLVIDLHFDRRPLPLWMHEGMACYFAADCEQALGVYTADLADRVRGRLERGTSRGGETLRRKREEFGIDDYAIAWSWIHFLNTPAHEDRFHGFLAAASKLPVTEEDPAAHESAVTKLLLATFPIEELEGAHQQYFLSEFALASPQQTLDYARHLVAEKGYDDDAEIERGGDLALRALAAMGNPQDPGLLAEAAELRLAALLLRFHGLDAELHELRLPLRLILDELVAMPAATPAIVRAELARRVLSQLERRVREGQASAPCDLRATLLDLAQRAPQEQRDALRALVVLCDDFTKLAREGVAAALVRDPLQRRALVNSLRLGVDAAPGGLLEVFPRLKLLVEIEPDDRNLASLALCYVALGDRGWAQHLWESALERSMHPASLGGFERWFKSD